MTEPSDPEDDYEVVASVDGDSEAREYVIADISTDSAWLAMDAEDAPTLPAWR
jgi:hypothetical protein